MQKIISHDKIFQLLSHLSKTYDIYAPIKKKAEIIFDKIINPANIVFDYHTTILPPTIYLLPPEEKLFRITSGHVREITLNKPFIIFGLNLKDLTAIIQLDQIMNKEPADTFYRKRRQMSTLIAISNYKVTVPPGGDLIFEKLTPDKYRVITVSDKGKKIIELDFFEENKINHQANTNVPSTKLERMLLDSELLARAVDWSRNNYPQILQKLGKLCLACGICSYVCPLCYCYTIEDEITANKSKCIRCRKRSACTLPGFAQIAGGYDFRNTQKDRYFNWFYHKFVRAYKEFGQAQCTACGRCQKYCPAGIDIEQVLDEIIIEFKKKNKDRNI
ncbi:hypothetical protein A2164_01900 [Candidatus Curtissbacteria bacterium RBG_13_35_7]|uniref:4Fe-4S ferredoxin-type domain-containing protein n=1 Tax=Candidatus Curtissbacteria bacterium RBG_13_35_7 TaxID=1797705 RepID=A0A1F5G4W6_9BACT|nr:MAG: hypothetical protein A2164_01900 [Candidatus Curtissbacteria bacterium RBG_13_35_7]